MELNFQLTWNINLSKAESFISGLFWGLFAWAFELEEIKSGS